jgi:hypothetical protein
VAVEQPPPAPNHRRRRLAIAALTLCALAFTGDAMGFFGSNVLFSAVQGQVTLNGQPVSGAEVVRHYRWAWNKSEGNETVRTDAHGHFAFGAEKKSGGMSGLLPHEPVIFQEIVIRHDGREYIAWQYTKHNYDDRGELRGKAIDLLCELSQPAVDNGTYFGLSVTR